MLRGIKTYYDSISELGIKSYDLQLRPYPDEYLVKKGYLYDMHQVSNNPKNEKYLALYATDNEEYFYFPKELKFPYYVKRLHKYSDKNGEYRYFDIRFPDSSRNDKDVIFKKFMIKDIPIWVLIKDVEIDFLNDETNINYYAYFDIQFQNALLFASTFGTELRNVNMRNRRLSLMKYPGYNSKETMFSDFSINQSPPLRPKLAQKPISRREDMQLEQYRYTDEPIIHIRNKSPPEDFQESPTKVVKFPKSILNNPKIDYSKMNSPKPNTKIVRHNTEKSTDKNKYLSKF